MNFSLTAVDNVGKEVELPQPIAFKHSSDWIGVDSDLTVTFAEPVSKRTVRLTAAVDGRQIFVGFVDSLTRTLNEKGDFSSITAVGDFAKLKQNQVHPKDWALFDSSQLLSNYCIPYGLTQSVLPNAVMPTLEVRPGMTAWDVIDLFCRSCYVLPGQIDRNGALSTISPVATSVILGEGGIAYTSLKYKDQRSKLLSRVYMKSSSSVFDYNIYTDNSYAIECGILRKRYCNPPEPWQSLPKYGANEIVKNSNRTHYVYEIAISDNVDLLPGDVVRIKGKGINETNFYIAKKVFSFNERGKETILTLQSMIML